MRNSKRVKQRIRNLFERDLPFGHKVERDRTKYTRKIKHKKAVDGSV